MGVKARSAHGAKLYFQAAGTVPFLRVAELGPMGDVGTSRTASDVSVHNEDIDTHILGIMRRPSYSFPMNWVTEDAVHQAMLMSHYSNDVDGWMLEASDGDELIFSGGIEAMGQPHPIEGGLVRNVTIRPSGLFSYNGNIVGAVE